MLAIVAGIANYFGKSNYGTFHLDVERRKEGVVEGIKSNSQTRFSSSYTQVLSVSTCMPPIKKCLKTGTLKFDTAAVSILNCSKYEWNLTQFENRQRNLSPTSKTAWSTGV